MPWLFIHSRTRAQFVAGATLGRPDYTGDPAQAMQFPTQEKARRWADLNTVSTFGEFSLMRSPGSADDDDGRTRRGTPSHYGSRTT